MAMGRATFNGVCKKCGGEIRKHVTETRWAPSNPGSSTHAECFFASKITVRDARGKPVDSAKQEKTIPDTMETELKLGVIELSEDKPIETTKVASLEDMIAERVAIKLQDKLNAQIDAEEVKRIAENAVRACADILRDEFTMKHVIDNKITGEAKKIEGMVHCQFPEVLAWVKNGFNVYLGGPAGGGKTHLIRQVAEAMSLELIPMQQSKIAFPTELKGFKSPDGKVIKNEFQRWAENGGLLYCSEYDAWSDNLKVLMNTALDNKFFPFPDGVKQLHKNCFCLADGNTAGGANSTYSGRDSFDASVKQRFMFVPFRYDEKLERKLAHTNNAESGVWIDWVQAIRKRAEKLNSKIIVTPRASIYGATMLGQLPVEAIAEATIFWGADRDSVKSLTAGHPYPNYPVQ